MDLPLRLKATAENSSINIYTAAQSAPTPEVFLKLSESQRSWRDRRRQGKGLYSNP